MCIVTTFHEFGPEENHTCLLLPSFLSMLIIWLAEILLLFRKIYLFLIFQDLYALGNVLKIIMKELTGEGRACIQAGLTKT